MCFFVDIWLAAVICGKNHVNVATKNHEVSLSYLRQKDRLQMLSNIKMSDKNKYRKARVSRNSGRNRRKSGMLYLCLLILAVLAVIFYCSKGLGVYHSSEENEIQISDANARLAELQTKAASDLSNFVADRVVNVDLDALQSKLMDNYGNYDYNAENFRRWFSDAAIVGDSVAEAIRGFDWINDVNLQSEVGISLYSAEDVIAGTEALQPSTIFLTFSANCIKSYDEYVDSFISDYTTIIQRLQESIPWAEIYVQGIIPCDPDFLEEYYYYEYMDDYNTAISKMCDDLGCHYFNSNFILEAHPEIYADDGLHPGWQYYPLWMTYMAEVAGLVDCEY